MAGDERATREDFDSWHKDVIGAGMELKLTLEDDPRGLHAILDAVGSRAWKRFGLLNEEDKELVLTYVCHYAMLMEQLDSMMAE